MVWDDALKAMYDGHTVRLPTWEPGQVMYLTDSGRLLWDDSKGTFDVSIQYHPGNFAAYNDWEIAL